MPPRLINVDCFQFASARYIRGRDSVSTVLRPRGGLRSFRLLKIEAQLVCATLGVVELNVGQCTSQVLQLQYRVA